MFTLDTIFENGRFQTMDDDYPYAGRIGVYDGKIVAIDDELEGLDASHHVDLSGRYVCPGFNDTHLHFSMLGGNLNQIDMSKESTPNLECMYDKIKQAVKQATANDWIVGWGFDQFSLGAFPDIRVLDAITDGHPLLITHISNHAAVINHQAFKRAGFENPDDIDEPDLVIKEDGKVTGLIKDKMSFRFVGLASRASESVFLKQLSLAAQFCLERGVTSFTDGGTGTDSNWEGIGKTPYDIGLYQKAYDQDLIALRCTMMPYFSALHDLGELTSDIQHGFGLDLGIRTGLTGGKLDIGPFKIILDGAFVSLSAYLNDPYTSEKDNYGVFSWDPEEFSKQVSILHREGWRMAVHAIGDHAVDIALDAIEKAQKNYPRKDVRHRLEHCGLADDATVERVIRDGIIANPQGSFMKTNGDGYISVLGKERADRVYRMGAFVHRGAIIPGSTDAPCAPVDPLIAIEGMVTRETPSGVILGEDERLSVDEALSAWTYGSAYASHKEDVLGTISHRKYADFTVLDADPHEVDVHDLHTIPIAQTIIGGEVEYDNPSL
ncbi:MULTISPECIES: amidohydrolase [Bifidobacterium]|jgi:predicted amidohydrolase YtcJ|uniref:Amidohydrolase n=1 Tax=Bifidobacterium tibiigranuli TaxID=2172043 RepID=A0A5N6S1N2_9BIFI|nr:amidohydrolase [Bifidobacterium tibiigranuli]KAE8128472.1 amidohydrolase [Bifidobacterium tibiigranuli]KAE8128512.1 amidohydrolase [Bifidobacterium tibiigranuli]MCI1210696.1 amidohydrolase [Bifidobacterium tibiigranuli]